MNTYNNDIDNFVYKFFSSQIRTALARHISENPDQFDLSKSSCTEAELSDMKFKYASNVQICDDTLNFDAIVSAGVIVKYPARRDGATEKTIKKRFRVHCLSVVEDCVKDFAIYSIEPYLQGKQKNESKRPTNNLIPIISRDDLDTEATAFLERYFPEALETPMAVPIDSILCSQLGLEIIKNKRLSTDFSIFGQICFSGGNVEVYGVKDETPHEITVNRGTILIDACTPFLRSIGCVKYTLAHEAYHWFRHRVYAAIRALLHGEPAIAYRCTTVAANATNTPQQELHWIEWQANKIAPRILMPQKTTIMKIEELLAKYGYNENTNEQDIILECVINDLANFFRVSKQAAKIRMIDLGYDAANRVYKYGNESARHTQTISTEDVVCEYMRNPEFKVIVDSGLFSYADNHFVINHELYVVKHDDGRRTLTEYAKANISDCALTFTCRNVYVSDAGADAANTGILHHANTKELKQSQHFEQGEKNIAVVLQVDELYRKEEDFTTFCRMRKAVTKQFPQMAYGIMQTQKWNSNIFTRNTLLGEPVYSRIKSGQLLRPDVRTVVAVCVGLDLDTVLAMELLSSAGHVLTDSHEHHAYFYIIHSCRGESIHERNEFLKKVGVTPLGTKARKSK